MGEGRFSPLTLKWVLSRNTVWSHMTSDLSSTLEVCMTRCAMQMGVYFTLLYYSHWALHWLVDWCHGVRNCQLTGFNGSCSAKTSQQDLLSADVTSLSAVHAQWDHRHTRQQACTGSHLYSLIRLNLVVLRVTTDRSSLYFHSVVW